MTDEHDKAKRGQPAEESHEEEKERVMSVRLLGRVQCPRLVWNKRRFEWRARMYLMAGLYEEVSVNGWRQQRLVSSLANFDECRYMSSDSAEKIKVRVRFWRRLRRNLDKFGGSLTPEERAKAEDEIARHVPMATAEDIESYRAIVTAI
jgi:hypothetical protein